MSDLTRRRDATRRTLAKYETRAFDWGARSTCIHLARTQLRNMGHRPPPIPDFRSALGARRALAKAGHANLAGLLDSLLPRIPPARLWLGDLAMVDGDTGFESICLWSGATLLGWPPEDATGVKALLRLDGCEILGAWRV